MTSKNLKTALQKQQLNLKLKSNKVLVIDIVSQSIAMWRFFNIPCKYHILIAFIVRLLLIVYSNFHDRFAEVPYTDIDYCVFTDASRHILNSSSPYNRHTYRYTPLIAILLIPNILTHYSFGKILFSVTDILVGLLILHLVKYNYNKYILCKKKMDEKEHLAVGNKNQILYSISNIKQGSRKRKNTKTNLVIEEKNHKNKPPYTKIPNYCMLFWIYNPVSIIITTRGNCDSIAVFLILLTLYFLQCRKNYFIAGIIHGIAIHIRLYPIVYSLSYFMYLSKFSNYVINNINENVNDVSECSKNTVNLQTVDCNQKKSIVRSSKKISEETKTTIFKKKYLYYLIPNKEQSWLIFGSVLSLTLSVLYFYYLYGYTFLYETYLYHLIRKDTRHNFSLFFYLQYLTAGIKNIGIWQKVLTILPQLVLLLVLSVHYGLNKFTLHFSVLTQTIVMVSYNSVLTSQYFIWILGIFPLTLWQFKMSFSYSVLLTAIWLAGQLAWLLPAYLLEFHGQNTFLLIWLQGVSFFCANMAILGRLLKCFMYKHDK